MSDDQVIGLAFVLPIVCLWLALLARGFADKNRPTDWVARRHRKIAHNGFKSKQGIR